MSEAGQHRLRASASGSEVRRYQAAGGLDQADQKACPVGLEGPETIAVEGLLVAPREARTVQRVSAAAAAGREEGHKDQDRRPERGSEEPKAQVGLQRPVEASSRHRLRS